MVVEFRLFHKLIGTLIMCLVSISSFAQINVNQFISAEELVQSLINTPCAEVSNVSSFTGVDENVIFANGIGSFDSGFTNFPFQSGVVLTTGDVNSVPGPNTSTLSDGGWSGDADLEAIIPLVRPSNDASWIEFDFTPLVSGFSFNFIMASEEFNQEFECFFSDAFAFILTDQITGEVQNLAVLPGSNTPIEVTNIHPAVDGEVVSCDAINEEFFGQYNFFPFNPEVSSAIDLNGQTTSLQAGAEVIPGNPYTIKIVVADDDDTVYNMAVFLEAGSFNLGGIDLGSDLLVENGTAVCPGSTAILDATLDSAASYLWRLDGVVIPEETNSTLEVSQPGEYEVDVIFGTGCEITDAIIVEVFDEIGSVSLDADFSTCLEEGSGALSATVIGNSAANVNFTWSLNGDTIVGETGQTLEITETGTYTVAIIEGACLGVSDSIVVSPSGIGDVTLLEDFDVCPSEPLTLAAITDEIGVAYQWFLNNTPIQDETNATLDVDTSSQEGDQIYSVRINRGVCEASAEVTVSFLANCVISQGLSPDATPGFNDFLDLAFLANRSGIENLQIYNRHGRIVFEQEQYVNEWRGQSTGNNELLPTGTYFYVINFTNEDPVYQEQATGLIYLNRNAE